MALPILAQSIQIYNKTYFVGNVGFLNQLNHKPQIMREEECKEKSVHNNQQQNLCQFPSYGP